MFVARIASGIIVAALRQKAGAEGGVAMILSKGDDSAGGIIAILSEKGKYQGIMERRTSFDGKPFWDVSWDVAGRDYDEMLQMRRKSDPDLWIVELDIADAQRFAVESATIC